MTADGNYLITVLMPVSNPLLPADYKTLPNGETWTQFQDSFAMYIAAMKDKLNGQADDAFNPNLTFLDELAKSITIQP